MKNLLLMLIFFSCACNSVKKATVKNTSHTFTQSDLAKDSVTVSEELNRLRSSYFTSDNEQLNITFFPETTRAMHKSAIIKDSGGTYTIYFGDLSPSAIFLRTQSLNSSYKDSLNKSIDSTSDQSRLKSVVDDHKKEVQTAKKSSRVPWYLITIVAILVLLFGYTLFRMSK